MGSADFSEAVPSSDPVIEFHRNFTKIASSVLELCTGRDSEQDTRGGGICTLHLQITAKTAFNNLGMKIHM